MATRSRSWSADWTDPGNGERGFGEAGKPPPRIPRADRLRPGASAGSSRLSIDYVRGVGPEALDREPVGASTSDVAGGHVICAVEGEPLEVHLDWPAGDYWHSAAVPAGAQDRDGVGHLLSHAGGESRPDAVAPATRHTVQACGRGSPAPKPLVARVSLVGIANSHLAHLLLISMSIDT